MPAGFYVAWHPWLDRPELGAGMLHKVGHSGDLARRLSDDAYVTTWPPGWRFVATFICPSKAVAARLEAAVL